MKKFFLGLVAGCILAMSTTTFASTNAGNVLLSKIKMTIDGQQKEIQTVQFNGSNYVSVRDMVSALNGDVRYQNGQVEVMSNEAIKNLIGKKVKPKVKVDVNGFDLDKEKSYTVNENLLNIKAIYGDYPNSYWEGDTTFIGLDNDRLVNPFDVELVN